MIMPDKNQKVFVSADKENDNSYISSGFFKSKYWEYLIAYKNAADKLVDCEKSLFMGTAIYPIAFLYHHFLELYLKEILMTYKNDFRLNEIKCPHNLLELWSSLMDFLNDGAFMDFPSLFDIDNKDLSAATAYFQDISEYDKTSESFRYPENKSGMRFFDSEKSVDLKNLKARIGELANILFIIEEGLANQEIIEAELMK